MMPKNDRPPGDERPFHTVTQIAKRWQCSEKKVRRLIKAQELVAHRFGNQVRISKTDRRTYERTHRHD